ncbi:DUF835 domain-containing protein [Thermococcus sp.]
MLSPDEYIRRVVEALKDKSPREALSYAILSEAEEVEYYSELAARAKRDSVKLLFIKMSEASRKHTDWLYHLFKKLYPDDEPLKLSDSLPGVVPFYSELEKAEDYLEVVRYWMQSELFNKSAYEILARTAENEDSRAIFAQLAVLEEEQYEELKKAHDLIMSLMEKKVDVSGLTPGGYLLTDRFKARCFLADILERHDAEAVIFTRDSPASALKFFGSRDVRIIWISAVGAENSINPREFSRVKKQARHFFESRRLAGKPGIMLIEDVGYLLLELGFKKLMDILTCIRDYAIINGGYLLITAAEEVFTRREWALLTLEFKLVS